MLRRNSITSQGFTVRPCAEDKVLGISQIPSRRLRVGAGPADDAEPQVQ